MARLLYRLGLAAATFILAFASARADEVQHSAAESDVNVEMIKALQKKIDARDLLIQNLLDRVKRLERLEAAAAAARRARAIPAAMTSSAAPAPAARAPEAQRVAQQAPSPQAPAPQSTPPQSQPPAKAPAEPGQFEVSEEDAQRALERALVQTGASLLQPGKFEFVPSMTYQFDQTSRPSQIALTLGGDVLITQDVVRSTQVEAGTLLRVGLPLGFQAEVGVPYEYKRVSTASRAQGAGFADQTTDEVGFGDPTLTLTKQLLLERGGLPGLFLSGTWDTNYGQTVNGVALGSGFNEFRASVTAVKRQDPLVFTAGLTYQTALKNRNIQPGDQYTPALGMLFAVSPETSLRFAQQVSFVRGAQLNGSVVPGSDQVSATFTFGLLSILARGLTLDLSANIGETPDAPDFSVRLAFPIRLN